MKDIPDAKWVRVYSVGVFVILLATFLRYYPLNVNSFVASQYIWTYGDGVWRRALLSSLASLLHGFNPDRMMPVIDAIGTLQIVCCGLLLVYIIRKANSSRLQSLALVLLLLSGLIPNMLIARGGQDGYAALVVFGCIAATLNGNLLLSIFLAALAALMHEAAVFFIMACAGMMLSVTEQPRPREIARIIAPVVVAAIVMVVSVKSTSISNSQVIADCQTYNFLHTHESNDLVRAMGARRQSLAWNPSPDRMDALCGAQFATPELKVRAMLGSSETGIFFAPCLILAGFLILAAQGTITRKLFAIFSLGVPLAILAIAWDIPRFWAYANGPALFAIFLWRARLTNRAAELMRLLSGAMVVAWSVLFLTVHQYSPTWERQEGLLPNTIEARSPDINELALGLRSLIGRPPPPGNP